MTSAMPSQCISCVHFNGPREGACEAFPKGVPDIMLYMGGDHRKPWPNQRGNSVFTLQDGKEEAYEDWFFTFAVEPTVE